MSRLLRDVRHVIVDRDGVLNEEAPHGGYITHPDAWRWISGSLQALEMLSRGGLRLSIATNQSGVGRGLMTARDLDDVHARMRRDVAAAGGRIDAVFVCPHAPGEGCICRKPQPGLILAALAAAGIPAEQTLVVGDALRDLQAARAAGVDAVLVLTGKGRSVLGNADCDGIPVYDDLHAFAVALLAARAAGDS